MNRGWNKTSLILISLLSTLFTRAQISADLIITNGRVLDGTGNSWYRADVVIKNGKILFIGPATGYRATRTIDAQNKIVSPGFIDVHTHVEGNELKNPTADNFIYDGVTSVITGNCGSSETNIAAYFARLDSAHLSINVATLIGHNDVRRGVMGMANRPPTNEELAAMEGLVDKAMRDGAVGFSTGLIYTPGSYSETSEVLSLAKVASRYHGVYASHMRDEGDSVTQAIDEALLIGREANMPVEISHFKLSGQQNWGRSTETVAMIKKARAEGIDVTIDQYPYTASSTSLNTLLPDDIFADGPDSVRARLSNPAIRKQVSAYMLAKLKRRKLKHFSYAVVANFKADTSFNGKSIEQINLLKGNKHKAAEEAQTVMDMVLAGGAGMVFHGMSDEDVVRIMQYPYNMFACDASVRIYGEGVPHPRGYGTNARVLAEYVREQHVLTLEEAVRRMTALPATKFHLMNRGLLLPGYAADILIFDENKVQDHSTFEKPHQYSTGFEYVLVNGQVVVDQGKHTGVRSGSTLKPFGGNITSTKAAF